MRLVAQRGHQVITRLADVALAGRCGDGDLGGLEKPWDEDARKQKGNRPSGVGDLLLKVVDAHDDFAGHR